MPISSPSRRRSVRGQFVGLICSETPAHLRDLIDEMHRQSDRLALMARARLIDCLIHHMHIAQLRPFRRVEALDRFRQSDVSLGDQSSSGGRDCRKSCAIVTTTVN